jgi:hypothetical protein
LQGLQLLAEDLDLEPGDEEEISLLVQFCPVDEIKQRPTVDLQGAPCEGSGVAWTKVLFRAGQWR